MAKTSPSINLLVTRHENYVDRFISWALSIGRVVVIVTELIALSAFLYRFTLDRELIDLHSKIRQEQSLLNLLKDNEETFRSVQNKLSLASNFANLGKGKVKIFKEIVEMAPSGMVFNNLTLQEDRVRINANLNSVSSLSNFVDSLKSYPKVDKVIIDKIENKPSSAVIAVSITATLRPEKNLYANIK